jgi:16S rRNA (cytidine1402-2'-O)-methyltransferase
LVLMPNMLDFGSPQALDLSTGLPAAVIQRASALTHWVVEDAKTARAFIKRVAAVVPLNVPLQSLSIQELPRRAKGRGTVPSDGELGVLLQPAHAGHDIGLLSEAGLAPVADPAARSWHRRTRRASPSSHCPERVR